MSSDDDDDLERGLGFRLHEHTNNPSGPQSARAGVFRIHTAVAGFRRLVNTIGTPNDNLHLRQRLQSSRVQIGQLVKETSAKLKPVGDKHEQNQPTYFQLQPPVEEIANNAKLAKDVQSILRDFQKAHHHLLTAEKDTIILSPNNNNNINVGQTSSFMESMRQEVILQLENDEIDLHDESMSMFEEREEAGMKEIEEQINEVNEIFRDLADQLVHEQQGIAIEGIVPNTEICNTAITAQATSQLAKASRNHTSESSMTCLSLVIFGVILLIVLILLAA
ncbi:PREDICTED: syntaxin-22-like isoform X2 [Ipomoea nil]|uniref:syntaxin-22-like isoform X2 n=1 Tax=Ipomoea nil TaxID=35883 RepID=UPI0009013543|nr:PREDICTED: syntaxin-22-like isoform X2 [Ipomoea nil]